MKTTGMMKTMTNKNLEHLMHLYDRAYKMCEQIKEVIESGSMQELDDISRNKGELFKSILRFEKTVKTNPEEEALRFEARKKIEHLEKANIELLRQKQEELKKVLQKVSKGKKITKAYLSKIPETYSSIDILE